MSQYTPHRGVLILVLGILSVVMCQLLGPVAWIMGKDDMRKIDSGHMDPEGRGLTQAGMVCGIIGTVMILITLLILVGVLVMALSAGAMESM